MNLLTSDELLKIAQRTLGKSELAILDSQLVSGSNDLLGYMGEYYHLHLKVAAREEPLEYQNLEYFVKSLPYNNEPSRKECERKGVFPKEALIYGKILPNIQKYATKKLFPKCYYCRDDIIVMENLAKDYRHMDPAGINAEYNCKLILEHLSELHACSMAWEEKENLSIDQLYGENLIELNLSRQNTWFMTGLKGIVFLALRHPDYQTEWAQKFIKEELLDLLLKTENFTKPSRNLHNALCHRDSWNHNLLFKFPSPEATSPSACCLIDFQLAKYCSPCLDVLYVLYMVLSAEDRNKIYDVCLDYYFSSLQSHLKRLGLPQGLVTREKFLQECEKMRLAGLLMWTQAEPQARVSPSIANRLRSEDPERFDYYLNEDRSELFLKVIDEQPGYEEQIMIPIKELLDYLITKQSEKGQQMG